MTTQIARQEIRYRHMGYSVLLAARVILYAPCHIQDSTCHGLCYISRGALAGTRNGSTMKDRSDDPLLYQRTFLPQSYISLASQNDAKGKYSTWFRRGFCRRGCCRLGRGRQHWCGSSS